MNFTAYQIITPAISLFIVTYAWSLVFRQKKTIWEGCLWTLFWATITYVALFPDQMRFLSDITGIHRNETAIMVTAIGVLFFIVFYLVIRIEELEQRFTKLIRHDALQDLELREIEEKEERAQS